MELYPAVVHYAGISSLKLLLRIHGSLKSTSAMQSGLIERTLDMGQSFYTMI